MAADLIPVAQYLRMSTEHRQSHLITRDKRFRRMPIHTIYLSWRPMQTGPRAG